MRSEGVVADGEVGDAPTEPDEMERANGVSGPPASCEDDDLSRL